MTSLGPLQFYPPGVKWLREKNPSADIHIKTDSEKSLKYFYMYLAALKQGWPHYRPVIMVDGSSLKARFGGCLQLMVTTQMAPYFYSLLVLFRWRPMNRGNGFSRR